MFSCILNYGIKPLMLNFDQFLLPAIIFQGFLFLYFYDFKLTHFRSSYHRCSVKKAALKKFAKFTGIHLCQSLFLIMLQADAWNFIKKDTLAQVFSCEFCKIFGSTSFNRTPPVAASLIPG